VNNIKHSTIESIHTTPYTTPSSVDSLDPGPFGPDPPGPGAISSDPPGPGTISSDPPGPGAISSDPPGPGALSPGKNPNRLGLTNPKPPFKSNGNESIYDYNPNNDTKDDTKNTKKSLNNKKITTQLPTTQYQSIEKTINNSDNILKIPSADSNESTSTLATNTSTSKYSSSSTKNAPSKFKRNRYT
jgi:hypothetical protein